MLTGQENFVGITGEKCLSDIKKNVLSHRLCRLVC